MASTSRTKHVLLFPFPGQGHLVAFLAIARLLRRELPDATVTLVSTPRNVAALRASSAAAAAQPSFGFHALPFVPADYGLPAGCESTSSLPVPAFITLFEAFEALEPAFDEYVSGLVGLSEAAEDICIIADALLAWTVNVARRRGCAHAVFVSCGAFGTAIYHALWKNMAAQRIGSDGMLGLPEHPGVVLHRSQLSPVFFERGEAGVRWMAYYNRLLPHGHRTDAVLINTVEEFEPTGLAMVRRTLGEEVPVWPIGPLVRGDGGTETDDNGVLRWLDSQPPSSVLYISFGSQNTTRPDQMMELAAALESSGRPFVWAIRPPLGFDIAGAFRDEWLPEGFEARARASDKGVLVRGWAPQVRILAHAATGAFLSHCGWNSVLESVAHGVPIVGWPLAAEQFYNARVLAEWGVGVEVARGNMESSGPVDRSKVAAVLETVMRDTAESAAMRQRAVELQGVIRRAWAEDGGSSRTALHGFLRAVRLQ